MKKTNRGYANNMAGSENPNTIYTDAIESSGLVFDIAMSTFHTLSYNHYNLGVIHDFIPERLGVWSEESPFWLFKKEYIFSINACFFVSNHTYSDWKHLSSACIDKIASKTAILYPIIDYSTASDYYENQTDMIIFNKMSQIARLSRKSILVPGGSLLQSHKATEDAIIACCRVLKSFPGSSILITGACIANEDKTKAIRLVRRCTQYNLHLVFESIFGLKYLFKLFGTVSVVLCPSLLEGFGMPVAESVLVGANVLARRNAGMHEAGGSQVRYFNTFDTDFDEKLYHSLSISKNKGMIHRELHLRRFRPDHIAAQFIVFVSKLQSEGLGRDDYLL
jgi:hypothetical protein